MGTTSKGRRLRKQSSVCERRREISVRFALNDSTAVNPGVTDTEVFHPNIEVGTLSREIEQHGIPLGEVDAKHVPSRMRLRRVRSPTSGMIPVSTLAYRDHGLTSVEGKAKGPQSGETTNEDDNAASALARLRTTSDPQRTTNN